ncbi:hypothetical protein HDU67_001340 [Dinochytrium kinnereticum]|nr:hypothetical protein HDU67_001340 [Dinochytrium kinnereticum]
MNVACWRCAGQPRPLPFWIAASKTINRITPVSKPCTRSYAKIPLTSTANLPTEEPLAFRPLKRTTFLASRLEPTVQMLHEALKTSQFSRAWFIYKRLHAMTKRQQREADSGIMERIALQRDKLGPDDHTRVLGLMVRHYITGLAARHAGLVWRNMIDAKHALDVRDMNSIMMCHLRNKDLRRVVETFQKLTSPEAFADMPSHQPPVSPDLKSYHLLVAAYSRSDMLDETIHVWNLMKRNLPGSIVDPESHVLLVEAYARAKDLNGLWSAFRQYREVSGGRFHSGVYDMMVLGLGLAGNHIAAFNLMEAYRRMWNPRTFDSAIKIFEASNDVKHAEMMWANFATFLKRPCKNSSQVIPLPPTFAAMMRLLAREGKIDIVMALHEKFEEHYPPNLEERTALVEALLESGRVKEAGEAYSEMVRKGLIGTDGLAKAVGDSRVKEVSRSKLETEKKKAVINK